MLSLTVGPRVRILFPPAASLLRNPVGLAPIEYQDATSIEQLQ
jgi:hypothetical protein